MPVILTRSIATEESRPFAALRVTNAKKLLRTLKYV